MTATSTQPPEIWAGFECTVNRIRNQYLDQTVISGHENRPEDLDLLTALGVRAVRYPILWERTLDPASGRFDWRFADERLGRLRGLGIRPIVGLVHHGSGPRHTGLLDPRFAAGLAEFALRVADRYPWVDAYTPVNEPLTTSRFSCLYGHWYPHMSDTTSWLAALLNQCEAIVRSMAAIRGVNPAAQLIQTDDLGKVSSAPILARQREYENERRWLGWDLVSGRLTDTHSLWGQMIEDGADRDQLDWLAAHPCTPDVIGINYYPSSERFLDHRLELYPSIRHGGNGQDQYVDTLTARVCADGLYGAEVLLGEAWERYGVPVAVTECHNSGFREEQVRWFAEVWNAAVAAKFRGVPVKAVTTWAVLGSYDWDQLVTAPRGYYEPGAFDLRSSAPRKTAVATTVRALADGKQLTDPWLDHPGWWRSDDRFDVPPISIGRESPEPPALRLGRVGVQAAPKSKGLGHRPLVIWGSESELGMAVVEACRLRGLHGCGVPGGVDLGEALRTNPKLGRAWGIVIALAPLSLAWGSGPATFAGLDGIADWNPGHQLSLLAFSSSDVFKGCKGRSYLEHDRTNSDSAPGRRLVDIERRLRHRFPEALVVRHGRLFGPGLDPDNTPSPSSGSQSSAGGSGCWTYLPDLVNSALDLLIDREPGIWHLVNPGNSRPADDRCAILDSERGRIMPDLATALERAAAVSGGQADTFRQDWVPVFLDPAALSLHDPDDKEAA
ncbi:MAG TPA: family 1 glycosylhydrolase [Chloroflexota bacterium]|nr:family 1 glycosylhydrolase [Chloroflexota bacterium]